MLYNLTLFEWQRTPTMWSLILFRLRCSYTYHTLFELERIGAEHWLKIGPWGRWF